MLRRKSLFLLATLVAVQAGAQRRLFRTPLPTVGAAGFYKVLITPEVTARSTTGLDDLRIKDRTGRDMPYLQSADMLLIGEDFHRFSIRTGKSAAGSTQIDIINNASSPIHLLQLQVRTTDVVRIASLSGSQDGTTFYSLRDSVELVPTRAHGDTAECSIPLPQTTYPFLRVEIFERGLLPLDVLGAGIYAEQQTQAQYTGVPVPAFTQTDSSDRKTYIRIRFAEPYRVDRLDLRFIGQPLFKRAAVLYANGAFNAPFTATHAQPATVWTEMHSTDALVVIDNEDNPPLRLASIAAWQQRQHLLAYLDASVAYALHFGDSSLPRPLYDLRHFRDSIAGRALPELRPGSVEEMPISAPDLKAESKPFIGTGSMWAVILLVLAGLLVATMSLVRQIKKKG